MQRFGEFAHELKEPKWWATRRTQHKKEEKTEKKEPTKEGEHLPSRETPALTRSNSKFVQKLFRVLVDEEGLPPRGSSAESISAKVP